MPTLTRRTALATAASLAALPARADARPLRISHGYSTGYLPMMVMSEQRLVEKHAKQAGLGPLDVTWQVVDGGNIINDAMLSGVLDIASIGVPGYLVLRDRTRGKRQEVVGISALNTGSQWLNTVSPRLKTLSDYGPGDRIAVPGIKTSYAAVVLQMCAAKTFGIENYARLDTLTVGIPHPEAVAALLSGKTEITSHMASAPFSYQELRDPKVHRVVSTIEVLAPMSILMTMTQNSFADANPGLMQAFLAAQAEANAFIAGDRAAAAQLYLRVSGLGVPLSELMETLNDPENTYDVVPHGAMTYATFLAKTGTLKEVPGSWKDLFLPALHAANGS